MEPATVAAAMDITKKWIMCVITVPLERLDCKRKNSRRNSKVILVYGEDFFSVDMEICSIVQGSLWLQCLDCEDRRDGR